jgi:transposase
MSGGSSGRFFRTNRAACRVWMTAVSLTISFEFCVQVRRGAICRRASVPARPTIAWFAGEGLDVWDQIMDALTTAHDMAVHMFDTSIVRVHQHGSCIAGNTEQQMGRSRGGLTSKIHAVVDTNGLPVRIGLTPGEAHDNRLCPILQSNLRPRTMLLADRGYDADWIRAQVSQQGAWANIPPKRNRKEVICFSPYLYRARSLVERFFNKIKQCCRIATRYDGSQPTTLPSSSSHQSGFGCMFMSPRPRMRSARYAPSDSRSGPTLN